MNALDGGTGPLRGLLDAIRWTSPRRGNGAARVQASVNSIAVETVQCPKRQTQKLKLITTIYSLTIKVDAPDISARR
jgi:hypothetical protein